MPAIDRLQSEIAHSLRGLSAHELRSALAGLEGVLDLEPRRRTQLTLRRLRLSGRLSGEVRFHSGVNVVRAGNDKGKSSLLKLIQLCLTGKNELKKDVDSWIDRVDLEFALDQEVHSVGVDKRRRLRGRLVRGSLDALGHGEVLLEFRSGRAMQDGLEAFFNRALGLRPLSGTQKDSRKASDALLDSHTSYRAYFRGLYITQDLGYTDLVTEGVPYGNLFMKIVGMLLGIRGLDGMFAVEARRAHLENRLAKEERYHRRLEASLGAPDLASLDEEIQRLSSYIDELKVARSARRVRSMGSDPEERLAAFAEQLLEAEGQALARSRSLIAAERELDSAKERLKALDQLIAARGQGAALCPTCGQALPEGDSSEDEERRALTRRIPSLQKSITALRAEHQECSLRMREVAQQRRNLEAQIRSMHQATSEADREIEVESRYLGRLEAQRESAARMVASTTEENGESDMAAMLRRKQIYDVVLSHLRTRDADANERIKEEFASRVREYCTAMGFPGLEDVSLDPQLKPHLRQNDKSYTFDELSPGEKVRFVLAFYLGLAIVSGEKGDLGSHPGLLLIDSPGKEEMVQKDFEAVVRLLARVESQHANNLQAIVATTLPAIRQATPPEKQIFVERDDLPLFTLDESQDETPAS